MKKEEERGLALFIMSLVIAGLLILCVILGGGLYSDEKENVAKDAEIRTLRDTHRNECVQIPSGIIECGVVSPGVNYFGSAFGTN